MNATTRRKLTFATLAAVCFAAGVAVFATAICFEIAPLAIPAVAIVCAGYLFVIDCRNA